MKYSSQAYGKAAQELQRRRDQAEYTRKKRREEVYAKIPALATLEQSISSASLSVIKAIGMGENAQEYIDTLAAQNLAAQAQRHTLLVQAGYPEDYLQIHYVCGDCQDSGFLNGRMCSCHKDLLRALAFEQLSEFSPVKHSGFDAFSLSYYPNSTDPEMGVSPREHMQKILSFCKDYAQEFDLSAPSLLFQGETGLGKTHLSLAIAGQVVNQGYGVVYGSAQNLLSKLEREKFSYQREQFGETEQTLLDCDLLILDDLGAEFTTQFTVASIYNIINTRLLKELPVIISTNLSSQEMEQKYSKRITSRVISCYIPFLFLGKDIRQLKRETE